MSIQVIPYLHVKGAARAIEFYAQAFGATEVVRLSEPGGRIAHAEIEIGGARIMLADEFPSTASAVRNPSAEPPWESTSPCRTSTPWPSGP